MVSASPLPILQNGDPHLRAVAEPLPEELFDSKKLQTIIADMAATLDREPDGVALAAPQVGISYRLFVVRHDRTLPPPTADLPEKPAPPAPDLGVYINPDFVKSSRRRSDVDEGCLSVRGVYGTTYRHERATIRARDVQGKVFERGAGGLLAQIFQHETDHLNGILFIDHAHNFVELKHKKDGTESEEPLSHDELDT